MQTKFVKSQGLDYIGTVRRLGLVTFRIAMILTALRIKENGQLTGKIECSDTDFKTAITMVEVFVEHSAKVFSELDGESKPTKLKNKKQNFMEALPETFNRKIYLEIAESLSVNPKTAEGYIASFIKSGFLHRESHDSYVNTSL